MLPPPTRKTPPVPPATPAPKAKTPPKSVAHNPIMSAIRPRNAPAPKANIMTAIKFSEFVDQAPEIKQTGEIYPLGTLKQNWIDAAKRNGIEVETPHIVVRDQDIVHTFRSKKEHKIPRDWYKNLPYHLQRPDAVLLDTTHSEGASLLLIYKGENKAHKLVVRLNYNVRKQGIMNIVGTGRSISKDLSLIESMIGKGYVLIEGSL